MNWLLQRLGEASTWAGLAGLTSSVGQLVDFHQAAPIADTITHVGQAVATGTNPILAGVIGLASLAAMFIPEKAAAPTQQ